jgi:DNA-directed RNA polymerase subunit RPC12/RpoP
MAEVKYNRDKYLKRKYKISLKQYDALLKKQGYLCAICGKPQKDSKLHFDVDHDHVRGVVRGLLCRYCNSRLLKYLRDDVNKAKGLVRYLNKWIEQISK